MKVKDIQIALYYEQWSKSRRCCAPNVSLMLGEQDWIEITQAGYVYEYEIKLTKADYKRDFHKTFTEYVDGSGSTPWKRIKHSKHDLLSGESTLSKSILLPKRFYFVCPPDVVDVDTVPSHAGLIHATEVDTRRYRHNVRVKIVKQAPNLKCGTKATDMHYAHVSRSLGERFFRLWRA